MANVPFTQHVVSNDTSLQCECCHEVFFDDHLAPNLCPTCRPENVYVVQDVWDESVGVAIVDSRTNREVCLVRHPTRMRRITQTMRDTASRIADNLYFMGVCE